MRDEEKRKITGENRKTAKERKEAEVCVCVCVCVCLSLCVHVSVHFSMCLCLVCLSAYVGSAVSLYVCLWMCYVQYCPMKSLKYHTELEPHRTETAPVSLPNSISTAPRACLDRTTSVPRSHRASIKPHRTGTVPVNLPDEKFKVRTTPNRNRTEPELYR